MSLERGLEKPVGESVQLRRLRIWVFIRNTLWIRVIACFRVSTKKAAEMRSEIYSYLQMEGGKLLTQAVTVTVAAQDGFILNFGSRYRAREAYTAVRAGDGRWELKTDVTTLLAARRGRIKHRSPHRRPHRPQEYSCCGPEAEAEDKSLYVCKSSTPHHYVYCVHGKWADGGASHGDSGIYSCVVYHTAPPIHLPIARYAPRYVQGTCVLCVYDQ